MVIGLLVDGVGSLFIDLLIEDEDAKRAAKVTLKSATAGVSAITGDIGSAIASGAGAAGELAKAGVKDAGGVAAIDTFVTVTGAFGGGVDVGLSTQTMDPLMSALEGGLKSSGATVAGMGGGALVGHAIDDEGGAMTGLRFGGGLASIDPFQPKTLKLSASRALLQVSAKGGGGIAAGSIAMAVEGGDAKEQRATFERWASLGQTAGAGLGKLGEYTLEQASTTRSSDRRSTATPDLGQRLQAMGRQLDAMGLRDLGRAVAGGTWILMSEEGARGRVGDAHANQGRATVSALALAWAVAADGSPKALAQGAVDLARDTSKVVVDATDGAEAARQELKNDRAGVTASDQDSVYERQLRRRAARLG
jgi:hypothetical protein